MSPVDLNHKPIWSQNLIKIRFQPEAEGQISKFWFVRKIFKGDKDCGSNKTTLCGQCKKEKPKWCVIIDIDSLAPGLHKISYAKSYGGLPYRFYMCETCRVNETIEVEDDKKN